MSNIELKQHTFGHNNISVFTVILDISLVIRSSGVSAIQGLLNIEVNGRIVGTFRNVRYIMDVRFSGVSVKRGSTV